MFGHTIQIKTAAGMVVTLKAPKLAEMAGFAEIFTASSTEYTLMWGAQTQQNEEGWFDSMRKDKEEYVWCIYIEGVEGPIGVTGIHNIDRSNSCSTGIIISSKHHGKGIASAAHLARTMWAADRLNRFTINSSVLVPNQASLRALMRVGYHHVGAQLRCKFQHGQFLDLQHLTWLHPERIGVLYPEGLPCELEEGVKRAQIALDKARKEVVIL
jgi:RimJ/RimL family protein N-acetyltransferase